MANTVSFVLQGPAYRPALSLNRILDHTSSIYRRDTMDLTKNDLTLIQLLHLRIECKMEQLSDVLEELFPQRLCLLVVYTYHTVRTNHHNILPGHARFTEKVSQSKRKRHCAALQLDKSQHI